ncbi:CHAD domain-containing protein [Geomonas sp. Red69]|uniref:CHAD domain-containing protein n=1 Tax=Geomonas diazotrophica TaxID=2843197 RepID=UPI001C114A66|nr:CHAD domain-containing protein [Geomonas diazotrophica]MBU5636768.1 CHAD domain-containing protein [Geomonas diazotrophica]
MSIPAHSTASLQLRPTRLWFAASYLLATLREEFFAHWRGAARGFDLDEVHDLRVASRRLREGLALFAPLLPGKKVARLSRRVKRLTTLLGELRNIDEALLFFSGLEPEETSGCRAEREELLRSLSKEREITREGLSGTLAGVGAGKLQKELGGLAKRLNPFQEREAPGFDPFTEVGLFAEGAFAERVELVEELFPAALREEDTVAQHRLRIAFKKLRYRLEILAPLLEDGGEELRRLLKRYQDLLGKLHDLDVFAEMAEQRLAPGTGRDELLQLLAAHRGALFAGFAQTSREQPLEPLTRRVSLELRLPHQPSPAGTRP